MTMTGPLSLMALVALVASGFGLRSHDRSEENAEPHAHSCSRNFLLAYVNIARSLTDVHLRFSGFDREDTWGFRALEPSRSCISSIALVLLKTGIQHNGPPYLSEPAVSIDYAQMGTAQKLLLFWRKPAVRTFFLFFCPLTL